MVLKNCYSLKRQKFGFYLIARQINTVRYAYNSFNQVTRVSNFDGELNTILYYTTSPQNGLMKQYTRLNGQTVSLEWNDRRWMTKMSHADMSLAYGYDGKGNMKSRSRSPGHSHSFAYDDVGKLTVFNGPWGAGSYGYDDRDNRTIKTIGGSSTRYSYDQSTNKMTSAAGVQYGYNGPNIITQGSQAFTYDAFNNVVTSKNSGSIVGQYIYDASNLRVYKDANNKQIYYHYSPSGQVLAELDQDGKTLFNYIYLNNTLVAKTSAGGRTAAIAPWLHLLLKGSEE